MEMAHFKKYSLFTEKRSAFVRVKWQISRWCACYDRNARWYLLCKMGVTGLHDSHALVLALIIVLL